MNRFRSNTKGARSMVDIPEIKSSEKPAAQALNRAERRVVRNVISDAGVVEARARRAPGAAVFLGTLLFFALLIFATSACVETAECNAAVTCPASEVCYEYECRMRCESAAQCGDGQVCSPCQTIAGTHNQGKCFGADLYACVDGNS